MDEYNSYLLDWERGYLEHAEHKLEQELGKTKYFHSYHIRVARVEWEYGKHTG
jgi:hypothetical protein